MRAAAHEAADEAVTRSAIGGASRSEFTREACQAPFPPVIDRLCARQSRTPAHPRALTRSPAIGASSRSSGRGVLNLLARCLGDRTRRRIAEFLDLWQARGRPPGTTCGGRPSGAAGALRADRRLPAGGDRARPSVSVALSTWRRAGLPRRPRWWSRRSIFPTLAYQWLEAGPWGERWWSRARTRSRCPSRPSARRG